MTFASPSIKHLLDMCPSADTAIISGRVGSSATVSVRVTVHTNLKVRGTVTVKCKREWLHVYTKLHTQRFACTQPQWSGAHACLCVCAGLVSDLVQSQLGNDTPHACFSGVVLPLLLRHAKPSMEPQELPDSGGPRQLWLLLCVPTKHGAVYT